MPEEPFSSRRSLSNTIAALLCLSCAGPVVPVAVANDLLLKQIHSADFTFSGNFVAADRFKVGQFIGGRRIASIGVNFTKHFAPLVEPASASATVRANELQLAIADTSLLRALGGDGAALTHLALIYAVMEAGASGASHTSWQSNIAFLRSPFDHRLWVIHWSVTQSGEWSIGAVNMPHAVLDWAAGTRVFAISPDRHFSRLEQIISR